MFNNTKLEVRDLYQAYGDINFNIMNQPPETPHELIIPLKVSKEEFIDAVVNEVVKGLLTPENIFLSIRNNEFFGMYIPIYSIKGDYKAYLTYTAVYNISRTITTSEDRIIDGKVTNVPVEKRIIEKNKTASKKELFDNFVELVIGANLLDYLDFNFNINKLNAFCEKSDFNVNEAEIYSENKIKDFTQTSFPINKNNVELEVKKRILKTIQNNKGKLQGDTQENIDVNIDVNFQEINKYFIPVWFFVYTNREKKYFIATDGYDRRVFYDNKPKEWSRIITNLSFSSKYFLSLTILLLLLLFIYLEFPINNFLYKLNENIVIIILIFIMSLIASVASKTYKSLKTIETNNIDTSKKFKDGLNIIEGKSDNGKKYYLTYYKK